MRIWMQRDPVWSIKYAGDKPLSLQTLKLQDTLCLLMLPEMTFSVLSKDKNKRLFHTVFIFFSLHVLSLGCLVVFLFYNNPLLWTDWVPCSRGTSCTQVSPGIELRTFGFIDSQLWNIFFYEIYMKACFVAWRNVKQAKYGKCYKRN